MKLLFLEDDAETARTIRKGLEQRGFEVLHAESVPMAREVLAHQTVDIAILDLMVPGGTGYDILGDLRDRTPRTPTLILTALGDVEERVEGLEQGADDYLTKPFAFAELLARLRALLRRPIQAVEPFRIGAVEIDPLHRHVQVAERRLALTRTEFDILQSLAEHRGEVVNRPLLLELVWGYRFDPGTNIVDVHVTRLRRKLESAGIKGLVRTVRGIGYVVD